MKTGIRLQGDLIILTLLTLDMVVVLVILIGMIQTGIVRLVIKKVDVVVNTIKQGLQLTDALDAPELRELATLVQNVLGCARLLIQILLVRLDFTTVQQLIIECVSRIRLKLSRDILALIKERNVLQQ